MKRWLTIFPLLLAGCAASQPKLGREVSLLLYPEFTRKTLSVVEVDPLSYIASMDVVPYVETTPGVFAPISSITGNPTTLADASLLHFSQASPIDPSKPILFQRLKAMKNYRIYGRAYDGSNHQISLEDQSFLALAISNDDAPRVNRIPITVTVPVSFAATTSIKLYTDGSFDTMKGYLAVKGNPALAEAQTTTSSPVFSFGNLQGFTSYTFAAEAYRLGVLTATKSIDIPVFDDTEVPPISAGFSIPQYQVITVAGGSNGTSDGVGTLAKFSSPYGVAVDAAGNAYIAQYSDGRIRKVTPEGVVTTLAGGASSGYVDGTGDQAKFNSPFGIAVGPDGNIYVADANNHCIRKVTPEGVVSTFSGNGTAGYAEGTQARFNRPIGIAIDSTGNIYVGDNGNARIRKIVADGTVSTLAGAGGGYRDGAGSQALFNDLWCVSVDAMGNVFVAENGNCTIRKVAPDGFVTTVAGIAGLKSNMGEGMATAVTLNIPEAAVTDAAGNIYITDSSNNCIRKVLPEGYMMTIAGGSSGFSDGVGTAAKFSSPKGLAFDSSGNLLVVDSSNSRLRKVFR